MKRVYYLFAIFILLVSSCSSDVDETGATGGIAGSVSDSTTGEPVATANVLISPGGKSTVTGSDGGFSFENLEAGEYVLEVNKEGYSKALKNVYVKSGDVTSTHILIDRLPASITADKKLLEFGDQVQTMSFTIVNRSYKDLNFSVEIGNCNWLSVIPEKGTLKFGKTETIVVNLIRDKLPMGRNEANIVVKSISGDGNVEVKVVAVNNNSIATLNTMEPSDITSTTAILNGEIKNVGEPKYTERGFVYSTNSAPTTEDCIQKLSCPVNTTPEFSSKIEKLITLQTYYVRAYLVQNGTVVYGNTVSFSTTKESTEVTTSAPTNVGAKSATLHGSITKIGVPIYSEKGFCYSKTNTTPDVSDMKRTVVGTSAGNFSLELTDLDYPATYYARAYAIQGGSVIYGNAVSFSTAGQSAIVSTSSVTDIFASIATFNGFIQREGNPPYSERGFCYSKNSSPTIASNKIRANGSGNGSFSVQVNNLEYPANYYVRGYVIQGDEVIYGNIVNFSTQTKEPVVNTTAVTNVATTSATLNGIITDLGIPQATRRGFCYSLSNGTPTINDSHWDDYLVNTANFSSKITDLSPGRTYYVRAYAMQDNKYIYGNTVSFTTNSDPVVRTDSPSNLTQTDLISWSVKFNGTVEASGNPAYDTRGFEYYMSSGASTKVNVSGSGTGKFSADINNLQNLQTYKVRAFVKVGNKYFYGEWQSFMTF